MSPPTGTLISGTPGMNCGWLNQLMGVVAINRGVLVVFCGYYPPKFVKFVIKSPGKFCEILFLKLHYAALNLSIFFIFVATNSYF